MEKIIKNNRNSKKIEFVTMGIEIDHKKGLNHRIRTILETNEGEWIFVELSQYTRPAKKYTNIKSQKEYLRKFPCEKYLGVNFLFRVDIPEDFKKNYTAKYSKIEQELRFDVEYTKENIIKFLQRFNKNITDYSFVDSYKLIEEIQEKGGFYRLYDLKLTHTVEPLKILDISNYDITFKSLYTCWNYNKTVEYTEIMENKINKTNLPRFVELYGQDTLNILIEEYNIKNKSLFVKMEA